MPRAVLKSDTLDPVRTSENGVWVTVRASGSPEATSALTNALGICDSRPGGWVVWWGRAKPPSFWTGVEANRARQDPPSKRLPARPSLQMPRTLVSAPGTSAHSCQYLTRRQPLRAKSTAPSQLTALCDQDLHRCMMSRDKVRVYPGPGSTRVSCPGLGNTREPGVPCRLLLASANV